MIVQRLLQKLERAQGLDAVAGKVSAAVSGMTEPRPVKNLLSGVWLGHPAHPLLTDLPIGAWTGAAVLDLAGGERTAPGADALVAFGIAAALPTALTGVNDWAEYNDQRVRRVGLVHAAANVAALLLHVGSLRARRRGHRARGVVLSGAGVGALMVGGYLGGHLSYRLGSAVSRTAFDEGPDDWVDVAGEDELEDDEPMGVEAEGVPVVLVREDGRVHALASRCNHMGGPLHDGAVEDGCIRCPWHGSVFRLADGSVARGPATAPQSPFEVRVVEGRIQVRALPAAEES